MIKTSFSLVIFLFVSNVLAQDHLAPMSNEELNQEIKNLETKILAYEQECVEDLKLTYKQCVFAKNALNKDQEKLNAYVQSNQEQLRSICSSDSLGAIGMLANNVSEINTKVTCTEADKKYYSDTCMDSLKCVLLASGPKIPGVMKFMYQSSGIDYSKFRSKDECYSFSNDCGARAILGLGKAIEELAVGIWDLTGIGVMVPGLGIQAGKYLVKKAKDRWNQFWNATNKVEDVTSDIALIASQMSPQNLKKLYFQAELWKLEMMQSMWEGLKTWMSHTVYCGQWSGLPFYSDCLRPVNTDCYACADMVSGTCSLLGVLLPDLIDLFFTAGGIKVAKWGPKIANKIFLNRKIINLLNKNKHLIDSSKLTRTALKIKPEVKLKVASLNKKLKEPLKVLKNEVQKLDVKIIDNIAIKKLDNGSEIRLLTKEQYNKLPDNTTLYDTQGNMHIKGISEFNPNLSNGFLNYGTLKKVDEIATTSSRIDVRFNALEEIKDTEIVIKKELFKNNMLNEAPELGTIRLSETRKSPYALDDDANPLRLINKEQYDKLPDGTVLEDINNQTFIKGLDDIDLDMSDNNYPMGFRQSKIVSGAGHKNKISNQAHDAIEKLKELRVKKKQVQSELVALKKLEKIEGKQNAYKEMDQLLNNATLRDFAKANNFKEVPVRKVKSYDKLDEFNGYNDEVLVNFTPKGEKQARTIKGRITQQYETGFDLRDANGFDHRINNKTASINEVYVGVKPNQYVKPAINKKSSVQKLQGLLGQLKENVFDPVKSYFSKNSDDVVDINKDLRLKLLSKKSYSKLPDGSKVYNLNGEVFIKGKDKIDLTTFDGRLGYGTEVSKNAKEVRLAEIQRNLLKAKRESNIEDIKKFKKQQEIIGREVAAARFYDERKGQKLSKFAFKEGFQKQNSTRPFNTLLSKDVIVNYIPNGETASLSLKGYVRSSGKNYIDLEDANGLVHRIRKKHDEVSEIYYKNYGPKDFKSSNNRKLFSVTSESVQARISSALAKPKEKYNILARSISIKLNKMERYNNLISQIKRNKNLSEEIKKIKINHLKNRMDDVNNQSLKEIQVYLNSTGLKTEFVTPKDSYSYLKISNIKKQETPLGRFFNRIKSKYQGEDITISLADNFHINPVDNLPLQSGGFHQNGRVELGYSQLMPMLDQTVSKTGKHELRHLIFRSKKLNNKPSVYHQDFTAYGNVGVLDNNAYSSYLSAEEIYNFSTDIGEYTRKYLAKSKNIVAKDDVRYVAKVLESAKYLRTQSDGVIKLTRENITLLDKMESNLLNGAKTRRQITKLIEDNKVLIHEEGISIVDDSGRVSDIIFAKESNLDILKKCFEVREVKTCNQSDLLNIIKIAKSKQQELNKVAGVQSARASKIIRDGQQNLYTSPDYAYIIDDDKLKVFTKDALRLSDGVKEGYRSYAGNLNSILPSMPIYQDISANPKKVAKFNEFMRYAKGKANGDMNQFLIDLNEIHITGKVKETGLDFAKGRKIKEFLEKYPEIEKEKLLELAKPQYKILGTSKPLKQSSVIKNKEQNIFMKYFNKVKSFFDRKQISRNIAKIDTKKKYYPKELKGKKEIQVELPRATADNIFSHGKELIYSPKGAVRNIEDINSLNIMTHNAEDLALSHEKLNVSNKLTNLQIKSKIKSLAEIVKSKNADIVAYQEVVDPAALEYMSRTFLDNKYKVLVINDVSKRFHKNVFLVKKDLPFDFHLHSFNNMKNGKHFVFGKDLPTLVIYEKGTSTKPLAVFSATHHKSKRINDLILSEKDPIIKEEAIKNAIEVSKRIRSDQDNGILKIQSEIKDLYGEDTPYFVMGDFNRNLRSSSDILKLEEKLYNSLDYSKQLPKVKDKITKSAYVKDKGKKKFITEQLDGIYADDYSINNGLLKESDVVHTVDEKGKRHSYLSAKRNSIRAPSDHAAVTLKFNFKDHYSLKKYPKLQELPLYQDITGSDKAKKILFNFLNKAKKRKVNTGEMIKDLNEIHLTGFKRKSGLDFSKGRKMNAFLKKYPQMKKDELLELAKGKTPVLGRTAKESYQPEEIINLISPNNFNERDLVSRFGEDYLFETLIMPRSIKKHIKDNYIALVKASLNHTKVQPGVFDYYINSFMQKYDDEMMDVLLDTKLSRQERAFASLRKLKSVDDMILNEINSIRKNHNAIKLSEVPKEYKLTFLNSINENLFPAGAQKISPFHYGKSTTFKTNKKTRDINDIRELKLATYNLKDLKKSGRNLLPEEDKRISDLAEVIKASKSDIISLQEVIDPKLLDDLRIKLGNEYQPMIVDIDELGKVHKTAFLVKKDLPFDFRLHSFQNYKHKNKTLFYKDLPTLAVFEKGKEAKPLMVMSGVHLKSSRGARDIASVSNLRKNQLQGTTKIRDEILDFYGIDTPYFVLGDFNQDLKKTKDLGAFNKTMKSSFEVGKKNSKIKYGNTQGSSLYKKTNGQLDGIYGNEVVQSNNLFKESDIIYAVDYQGKPYTLDEAFKKGRKGPSDHALVSTTLDFRSLYNVSQQKLLPLETFEIFKDASLAKHKLKALNEFLDFAYKVDPSLKIHPKFLSDLNEIHMTGKTLESGLDFSKGREMVKFLDQYTNGKTRSAFKEEVLKLAKKGVEVLGHKPNKVFYSADEALTRITFMKGSDEALEMSFGIDPLYEAFIGPRGGLRRNLKKQFLKDIHNTYRYAKKPIHGRELINKVNELLNFYDKSVLNVIDRKGFGNEDKIKQVFYKLPEVKKFYIKELNKIRSDLNLNPTNNLLDDEVPVLFKIQEVDGNKLFPDLGSADELKQSRKRQAFEDDIRRKKKANQTSRQPKVSSIEAKRSFKSFADLKIYNDAKTDPLKLQKINEFFNYAQSLGYRMGNEFYLDLNKIHTTGEIRDTGLDFSKGRLMVELIEKYAPKNKKGRTVFKDKILELASKPYTILGEMPEKKASKVNEYFEVLESIEKKTDKMKNLQETFKIFQESKKYDPAAARQMMRKINGRLKKENDLILADMQKLLAEKGIETEIITDFNQAKALKLKLDESSNSKVISFLKKVKEKYPLDRVTYGPFDNIKYESVAFYTPTQGRLDLGQEQTLSLAKDLLFPSTKHELRHLIFHSKKKKGEFSPFQISFDASDFKKLNDEVYKEHLSAEEIYNYSTDIGTSSRNISAILKKKEFKQLASEVDEIKHNLKRVMQVSKMTNEFTDFQINNLSKAINKLEQKKLSDLELLEIEEIHKIKIEPYKKRVTLLDPSGRETKVPFVFAEEVEVLHSYNIPTPSRTGMVRQPQVLLDILKMAKERLEVINQIANDRLAKADKLITEANFIDNNSKEADIKKFISNTRSFSDNVKVDHKSYVGKP